MDSYLTAKGMQPLDPRSARWIMRLIIAQRFGWTLAYIDALDAAELGRVVGYLNGRARAE